MKSRLLRCYIVAAAAVLSLPALAGNTIYGSSFGSGNSYVTTFAGGIGATFSSAPGTFQIKSGGGVTGVGISGATAGEIDRGETLTGSFSQGVQIAGIRLGLLFDGPEYNDVNEVAQVTAFWASGGSQSFTLTATGTNLALWTGSGSVLSVGSGAINAGSGAWDILNPFGNQLVSKLAFTALKGLPSATCPSCTNQSDYTLVSVTAVPEPETYAMMLAGLALMGVIARRRKQVV